MAAVFVRSGFPFNYDADMASEESGLECKDPTLTKQAPKDEVDINTIVRRFHLTGQLPVGVSPPTYMDFDGVFDFQSAMNVVRHASESFMEMPADVRARFHNSEQEFYSFILDEGNRAEAEKLGLVLPVAVQVPMEAARTADGRFAPGEQRVDPAKPV